MANFKGIVPDKGVFAFLSDKPQFGIDNCATHHVCTDINLFVGEVTEISNVGIRGVRGVATALGIGTVEFYIISSESKSEKITLRNVLYLPNCPKNLISVSKWSKDRGDNAGAFSRGEYSIFLWNHDNSKKIIHYSSNCSIPLMTVNEGVSDVSCSQFENKDDVLAMFDTCKKVTVWKEITWKVAQ